MKEFQVNSNTCALLEDFDFAFAQVCYSVQDILQHIKTVYNGNKEQFLNGLSHDCDYFSTAQAIKCILDFTKL